MRNVSEVCISACQIALCCSRVPGEGHKCTTQYTYYIQYYIYTPYCIYTHTTELPILLNYFPNILNWREERKFPCVSIPLDMN